MILYDASVYIASYYTTINSTFCVSVVPHPSHRTCWPTRTPSDPRRYHSQWRRSHDAWNGYGCQWKPRALLSGSLPRKGVAKSRHSRHLRNFGWQIFCLKSCTKTFRFCCRIIVVMPLAVATFATFWWPRQPTSVHSHPPWIYTTWKLMESRSRNIGTLDRSRIRILLIAIASSPFLESKLTSWCSTQKGLAFKKPS